YMKKLFLTFVVLSVNLNVSASEPETEPNWYLGAGLGVGDYGDVKHPDAYDSATDRLTGELYLGYRLNPYFSSELSYQYLGSAYAKYPQGEIKGDFQQVVLAARLGYPLDSAFYPYAKLGGAAWFGNSEGLREANEQGFAPVIGAGIEYAFTESLVGRVEYQYTDSLGDEEVGYTNHHMATLGLAWQFGHSKQPIIEEPIEVLPQPVETQTFVFSEQKQNHLFAFDSSQLNNKAAFTEVLSFLEKYPQAQVVIEGYTDSVGSEEYNQKLSSRRAKAVAQYFIEQGVEPSNISTVGKGEESPIADNTTVDGRAMNRRIEISIPSLSVSTKE
ncbi:OmpA family protein, partial [Vibrio harveyi]|uniref:OmpA family protein n=2 Tax=Vibrio harveyi TaxID=669 RepID=UPI003CEC0D5C